MKDQSEQVVRRHVDGLLSRDRAGLESLVEDYAVDAVAITSSGLFAGTTAIWAMLERSLAVPSAGFEVEYDRFASDIVIARFVINRGQPSEVTGCQAFVVREGKIAFQAIIPAGIG